MVDELSVSDSKQITDLQYRFHTWNPIPHPRCEPGTCVMRMHFDTSTNISVCSRDSHNVHICTRKLCTYSEENYASNDIVCKLTGVVICSCDDVPDFISAPSRRICRFKFENQMSVIDAVLNTAIALCLDPVAQTALQSAAIILRNVIYFTYSTCMSEAHQFGQATPRKIMFFSATCIFMMRCGIQPYRIMPQILQLSTVKKSALIALLARRQAIKFTPKTMSDYGTLTLRHISSLPISVINRLRCNVIQLLKPSGLCMQSALQ